MLHDPIGFSVPISPPWGIPFVGILLSLALFPIFAAKFWHQRYGHILFGWIVSFLVAFGITEGVIPTCQLLTDALLHHYIPFMAMITVLFTVGGGIHIKMQGKASPLMNAGLLGVGAVLSNLIGTTGASMLLIRPVIALNRYRQNLVHIIIFFIFLVSNLGGVLTPLGDPPLFIGFLNGVDFFWPARYLFFPFLIVCGIVLFVFWVIDHYYFFHDTSIPDPEHAHGEAKIQFRGRRNLLLIATVILVIVLESKVGFDHRFDMMGVPIDLCAVLRDLILFSLAILSWKITPKTIHEQNRFTFEPLEEVALVFLGIFITVIPVLAMLKAGQTGPLGFLLALANPSDTPDPSRYFWLTGILSAFLDNAPTYLVFFNMAGGNASFLMNQGAPILVAISLGAVFMGAMTYIGNAPNFMVRGIAVRSHIKMPGFLGYLGWSMAVLLPILAGFSWFWFP